MEKTTVAICYDFDKTLATNDMQTFSFIPNLGLSIDEFWERCSEFSKKYKVDKTLAYLRVMIDICKEKKIKLTKEYLNSLGKDVEFFKGVTTWFKRINSYAKKREIALEHYVISSGNKEILDGCKIAKELRGIYACEFLYGENGEPYWPKSIVNYTIKTQFLFRIIKGAIDDIVDDELVNQRIEKKHVEFRNMIYIGDGYTDIPSMTLVKEKGGTAISVFQPKSKNICMNLLKDERVNYACLGDYSQGSELENLVKLIIDSISKRECLIEKEKNQKKNLR